MSTQENVQIVKDFFAAMGSGDMQALLALSAEDIEWIIPGEGWPSEEGYMYDIPSGTKFRGKAIGDSIAALASAFPDVHRELLSIYVAENVVVVELRIRGTHKGELALGSKTIAPTGKVIDVPCVDVFHLESGKVISFNCYNMPSVMQQQLGLVSS